MWFIFSSSAFRRGKNKQRSGKTKQNKNQNSPHQHAANNDDWEFKYCPIQSRGKTYRELVRAYDFSKAVEDSDEYKMWYVCQLDILT